MFHLVIYGDAVASAALTLTALDVNKDIRCEVEYDGLYNAMNYTMNTNLSKIYLFIANVYMLVDISTAKNDV